MRILVTSPTWMKHRFNSEKCSSGVPSIRYLNNDKNKSGKVENLVIILMCIDSKNASFTASALYK